MGPEGIEPSSSVLETDIINHYTTDPSIISGILLIPDFSNTNILFLPIKNLSFLGFLWQINKPKLQLQSAKYLFNCFIWEIEISFF